VVSVDEQRASVVTGPPKASTDADPAPSRGRDVARPIIAVAGTRWARRAHELLLSAGAAAYLVEPAPRNSLVRRARVHRDLLGADVVLGIHGRARLGPLERLAIRLGRPKVVEWVGTDVLQHAASAEAFTREAVWNWCESSWISDELHAAGFRDVDVVPLTCTLFPDEAPPLPERFGVVAYTPDGRHEFYGLPFVVELARRLPDVPFDLLATKGAPDLPTNVRPRGWVEDMDGVLRACTVYLRPVAHDGVSHTVLEALSYGRYVVWTYAFPGVERIDDVDAVERFIRDLAAAHRSGALPLNLEGRAAVEERFSPPRIATQLRSRLEDVALQRWTTRPARASQVLRRVALELARSLLFVGRRRGLRLARRPPQPFPGDQTG
jgi:hypothetical protein